LSLSSAGEVCSHVQPLRPAQACFTSAQTPFVLHSVGQSTVLSSMAPFSSLSTPSPISGVMTSAPDNQRRDEAVSHGDAEDPHRDPAFGRL
jgi:hypothetical protein